MVRSRPNSGTKYNGWGAQTSSDDMIRSMEDEDASVKSPDPLQKLAELESGVKHTHFRGPLSGMGMASFVTLVVGGLAVFFLVLACLIVAIHRVQEGHLGLYYKHGALMNETTAPGIHWRQPFATEVVQIKVTPETKVMNPLICTTRDGVRNIFRDVQVISSLAVDRVLGLVRQFSPKLKYILVYDRVAEAIQVFCASHSIDEVYNTKFLEIQDFVNMSVTQTLEKFAPNEAVKLWKIFLPKPDVPPAIAANYRKVKVEWTEQLVAQQKQKTQQILKETEKLKAVADADRSKAVQSIETAKQIDIEEGLKNISRIHDQSMADHHKIMADVSSYVDNSKAESNQKLLTDNYIKLQLARSIANNTKMFFSGENSALGAVLSQLLKTNK